MTDLDAVEGGAEALTTVDGGSIKHAHFVEQSLAQETAVDVSATHHADTFAAKLILQDAERTAQVDARLARGFMYDVAEVARRIGQFRGTIGNGGQTMRQLSVLSKIRLQQVVETHQQVILTYLLPTIGADRYGCSIPVSGANSPADVLV